MGTLWRHVDLDGRVLSLIDYWIPSYPTEPILRYSVLYEDTRIQVNGLVESVSVRYFIGLLNRQRIVKV